jgi:hypothetical protein
MPRYSCRGTVYVPAIRVPQFSQELAEHLDELGLLEDFPAELDPRNQDDDGYPDHTAPTDQEDTSVEREAHVLDVLLGQIGWAAILDTDGNVIEVEKWSYAALQSWRDEDRALVQCLGRVATSGHLYSWHADAMCAMVFDGRGSSALYPGEPVFGEWRSAIEQLIEALTTPGVPSQEIARRVSQAQGLLTLNAASTE